MVTKKDKYEIAKEALVSLSAKVIALDRNAAGELDVESIGDMAFKKIEEDIKHISDVILEHQIAHINYLSREK